MALGSLTPPVGTLMFITCSITKCRLSAFIKEGIPFYILMLVFLLLLTFFPAITTTLVNIVY
jgi:TRAP-type C4-dicarboxylate transport system permease large subunit